MLKARPILLSGMGNKTNNTLNNITTMPIRGLAALINLGQRG